MNVRADTGRRGEDAAVAFLRREGFAILERNYRCAYGEIDVVARDGESLVFVEVRARASAAFGTPEESITGRKSQKMIECAHAYLLEHDVRRSWRIDLAAVELEHGRVRRLDYYRHVLQ